MVGLRELTDYRRVVMVLNRVAKPVRCTVTEPKFEPQPKITKIKNKSVTLFIKLQNQKQL
jgi:hypothetical protein